MIVVLQQSASMLTYGATC